MIPLTGRKALHSFPLSSERGQAAARTHVGVLARLSFTTQKGGLPSPREQVAVRCQGSNTHAGLPGPATHARPPPAARRGRDSAQSPPRPTINSALAAAGWPRGAPEDNGGARLKGQRRHCHRAGGAHRQLPRGRGSGSLRQAQRRRRG